MTLLRHLLAEDPEGPIVFWHTGGVAARTHARWWDAPRDPHRHDGAGVHRPARPGS